MEQNRKQVARVAATRTVSFNEAVKNLVESGHAATDFQVGRRRNRLRNSEDAKKTAVEISHGVGQSLANLSRLVRNVAAQQGPSNDLEGQPSHVGQHVPSLAVPPRSGHSFSVSHHDRGIAADTL